jgi:hypothetical protein
MGKAFSDPTPSASLTLQNLETMRLKTFLYIIMILWPVAEANGQHDRNVMLSGVIRDLSGGENLSSATVWVPSLKKGTSSNNYGYYALPLPPGKYSLEISFVGFQKISRSIELKTDSVIDWSLVPGIEVEEVNVTASRRDNTIVNAVMPGIYHLSSKKIELSPALLGESDALKTIQLFPGVKAGNEGTSGFNVRGGSHDQNLILLDGVPVYNTNHLFGYLSTFNTDAIRDIRFYKGGIPARYGGRLSSVVDITMKEGNLKKTTGQFSLSPIAGRLMLEGPIKKEVASFMISGRRTWLDLPLQASQLISGYSERMGYSFYDLNAKINWIINKRNRIFLSHYQGKDGYFVNIKDSLLTDKYSFNWGNLTSVIRWNLVISPRLFVNTSIYHSLYRFKEKFEIIQEQKTGQISSSGLKELTLKSDFDLSLNNHAVKFGYQLSWQSFSPEITLISRDSTDYNLTNARVTVSNSLSLFLEDEINVSPGFILNPGMRLFIYHSGNKTIFYPEPRIAACYSLKGDLQMKLSVQKMVQPIHLLTNNALNMPTDLWVTSGEYKLPSEAWLFDLGFNRHFTKGYSLEMDIYYKPMRNLLEYRPGISLLAGSGKTWEEITLAGKGLNYGAEIMLEKTTGRFTGWVGYSLSWAKRKFAEINNGAYFPFRHDRRHDLSLLANYTIKETTRKQKIVSLVFVFASGNAITIPDKHVSGMLLPGLDSNFGYLEHFLFYETFPHPNNYRMPPFHHLDIAYSATKKLKKERERSWKFSVYNVYNRLNPYFYYKERDKFMQISMLPIVPSVSYSLKF